MKKIICLLLTLFMIMAVFASCNNPPADPGDSELPTVNETNGETDADPDTDSESESTGKADADSEQNTTESDTEKKDESESETGYGTLDAPVSTTHAYNMCSTLAQGKTSTDPFYVKGTVTSIGEKGNYYKNVYFTDGKTGLLIYTLNMGNGISGVKVGDTITVYGYIKNYNGTIEMATGPNQTYVYVLKVETSGGATDGDQSGNDEIPDTNRTYTDFTSDEKSLFNSIVGIVIPFIPNDEYYVEESEEYADCVCFYTFGNTEAEFNAYRALFSSFTYEGTETDEYGDAWYYYSKGNVMVDMSYYYYENEYVVDVYVYLASDDSGDSGDVGGGDQGGSTTPDGSIDYGTLSAPVTTTYAYNACKDLASGKTSANQFYVKGTITRIGESGSYYKNVYFTDGTTEMLIYTLNKGNGISGVKVGDTITAYGYIKNYDGTIEMATGPNQTFVYVVKVENSGGTTGGGTTGGDQGGSTSHTYTDFTNEEKELLNYEFGFVIPFIPNSDYTLKEYTFDNEIGYNFYTYGNTQAEFDAYLALFSKYTDGGVDDSGEPVWYLYSHNGFYIDVAYYEAEDGVFVTDVYIYITDDSGSGDQGGSTGGDQGGTTDPDVNLITNDGKGLPTGTNGIFDVDFTKGNYVQNVTDQGYYIDGCPTMGSPAVLVIPVEFSDVTAQSKGYTIDKLEKIFNGTGSDTIYYSVHDYFYISSYGKLDLDITVVDSWFCPENDSDYYADAVEKYDGVEIAIGDQLILDEALADLATVMDLSKFDSDKNGVIDAVVMVNTLDIDSDVDFQWAYRYWNIYADDDGNYYEYDEVSANDYIWMCYEFMFEGYDEEMSETNYDHSNPLNAYTFIHEFSHILGADDYYDTAYEGSPMGGYDMMDAMTGDHNPYTKFNYGWLTSSKLIVTDSTVTVTLDAYSNAGDTLIIANNWDESLGAYQEYYVIMYYTATGLNAGEGGYFSYDGIVVYHINSSLYAEDYEGKTYYDVYNNNTSASDEYGTADNLIEYVTTAEGNYTFMEGDTLPTVTDDSGNTLIYTFTVDELTASSATLTFTRK